jgi:hypothetical protein
MRKNPEHLAWIVLLASFFACIGLAIGLPLGARAYVLSAQRGQNVTLEVQRGTLRVTQGGVGAPIAIAEAYDDIGERDIITTDLAQGRLVFHASDGEEAVVGSVQLYDNTEVTLSTARSPRFSISRLPHKVALNVQTGRVRISIVDTEERPTIAEVVTPHGTFTLTEGSYEVKVNAPTTEVTVRSGQADIHANGGLLSLEPAERAVIGGGLVKGPLTATRNLVTSGDFQSQMDGRPNGWEIYGEQTDPQQPPGEIGVVTHEGRQVVSFYRSGTNHAEVGIKQGINYDVRDFASLEMHLAVRIISENIAGFGGCGYLGSECPIIVRLDYKDVQGTDRQWQHGFYIGEPAADWYTYEWAEPVPPESWQAYDSGNLMEEMGDVPPALIKSLTIYASGHSFHAMVTEVELLAQE